MQRQRFIDCAAPFFLLVVYTQTFRCVSVGRVRKYISTRADTDSHKLNHPVLAICVTDSLISSHRNNSGKLKYALIVVLAVGLIPATWAFQRSQIGGSQPSEPQPSEPQQQRGGAEFQRQAAERQGGRGGSVRGGRGGFGGGQSRAIDRSQYPQWEIDHDFSKDVFTFARIQYDGRGWTPDARWNNDYPDADLNFSYRLQQLTSMEVDPNGVVVRLDDPKLFDYPFAFMIGVTGIDFSEGESAALRAYLLNGGFLMVDDFWTPAEWRHIEAQMKTVFPELTASELPPSHPIFHLVYELKGPIRCPSINAWKQGYTFEYWHGDPEGDEDPHFMGYHDKNGRLMAVFCMNNDICDGWEREGENHEFFELFSERVSYPLGINIVIYALTH